MNVICPYCRKPADWVENSEIYGRNFGKSFMCYLCRSCDAYVGCHNNTRLPLGTLADKALRSERVATHGTLDWLWRTGRYTRNEVYASVAKELSLPAIHIGESDAQMCSDIREAVRRLYGKQTEAAA